MVEKVLPRPCQVIIADKGLKGLFGFGEEIIGGQHLFWKVEAPITMDAS